MKLRKLWLSVFVVLFVGFGTALGQEKNEDSNAKGPFSIEDLNNPGIEHNSALSEFGLQYFLSFGFDLPENNVGSGGNVAIIEQVGVENRAKLNQSGSNIYGKIRQDGNLNKAFVDQKGNQLISIVNMRGNNNYLDFFQNTNNKGAFFQFQGNNMQFDAQQVGSGLQLTPRNSTMTPIRISSNQSTVPVIISN